MGRLAGRTAVVTGASSGIGAAIARAYVAEGARVVLTARREQPIRELAAELVAAGGEAVAVVADVTDDASIARLVAEAERALGPVTVLVNNAGIYRAVALPDAKIEDFRSLVEVNYLGAVRTTLAFLPGMLARNYGKVVNIASTAGKYGSAYQSPYNGSKHAVVGFTRSAGLELAKTGVRINAVCPGFVETPMLEDLFVDYARAMKKPLEETKAFLAGRVPIGRYLQPEEVAHLAVYLGSAESDGMAGQALTISGGMLLI